MSIFAIQFFQFMLIVRIGSVYERIGTGKRRLLLLIEGIRPKDADDRSDASGRSRYVAFPA